MNRQSLQAARAVVDKPQTDREGVDGYDARLCIEITLYFKNGFSENRQGILTFYQKAIEQIGDQVRYFLVNSHGQYKKRRKDTLDLLPFWAAGDPRDYEFFGLDLECDPVKGSFSEPSFQVNAFDASYDDPADYGLGEDPAEKGTSVIRLTLPAEYALDDGPQRLLAIALEAARDLKFISGHAGFSANAHPDAYRNYTRENHMAVLSRRFPGIDLGFHEDIVLDYPLSKYIKRVNWLTFLGDALIDTWGGRDRLLPALGVGEPGGQIACHPLPHGLCIQAGAAPDVGDVNQGQAELLPAYRQVGRVLRPLRAPPGRSSTHPKSNTYVGTSEDSERYLAYFDE